MEGAEGVLEQEGWAPRGRDPGRRVPWPWGDRGDAPAGAGGAGGFMKGSSTHTKKCRSVVINAEGIECFWRGAGRGGKYLPT